MSARAALAAVALFMTGALLTGCASTTPPPPAVAHGSLTAAPGSPTELCALDALLWSYGFVPRAWDQKGITILGTVTIAEE